MVGTRSIALRPDGFERVRTWVKAKSITGKTTLSSGESNGTGIWPVSGPTRTVGWVAAVS